MGKNIQVNDTLERVRDVLRHSKKVRVPAREGLGDASVGYLSLALGRRRASGIHGQGMQVLRMPLGCAS